MTNSISSLLFPIEESSTSMPDPIQRAREYVQSAFQGFGCSGDLEETALIREGVYCGHRFTTGPLSAVWFFEESEVKIFGTNKQLLCVQSLDSVDRQQRRAA